MRPYQAPVNTAAASYPVIWALWNVEMAGPLNPWESSILLLLPLCNVGRQEEQNKSVSGQEAEFN